MTIPATATEPAEPAASTPWEVVERHLIATGALSPEGLSRRAQPRRCRNCSAPTLVGLDADWASLRADADPTPVDAVGELLAQLEGRRTFALVRNEGRYVLDYRDAGRILHRPAAAAPGNRHDVLVEHRCGTPPRRFPRAASNLARHHDLATALTEGAPCPF